MNGRLPVRPGEGPWTSAELEQLRTELEDGAHALRGQIAKAAHDIAEGKRALSRIDAGTYGVCESCGQPIGKARLRPFPQATLCVACKQRQERRSTAPRPPPPRRPPPSRRRPRAPCPPPPPPPS